MSRSHLRRHAGAAALLALLASCHPARTDPRAVTPGEDAQLNEAAANLAAETAPANDGEPR